MRNLGLYLLLLVFTLNHLAGVDANSFIEASCRATRYPDICIQCLSAYTNKIQESQQQLAEAALAVSWEKARSTTMFLSKLTKARGIKPKEFQAIKDCISNMGDTVDQLGRSISEMSSVGRQDFMWHMSNVQTWVSAALTNENTCLDGFSGPAMDGRVKASIRRRVVYVAQVTSNALALVSRFAGKHHAAATTTTPRNLLVYKQVA